MDTFVEVIRFALVIGVFCGLVGAIVWGVSEE